MKQVLLLRLFCLLCLPALAACDGGTEPLRPAAFEVAAGSGQSAVVGGSLAAPPAVRVVSSSGKPVPGVNVVFTVSRGGGAIVGGAQKTGSDGVARLGAWTLGTTAGENALTVTSPAMQGVTATITAEARPDVPAGVIVAVHPGGSAASGSPLPVAPVVQLADRFGNPTPQAGVSITATAAGTVNVLNPTQVTDAAGSATFRDLTLSGVTGSYVLAFKAAGLTDGVASAVFLGAGAPHHLGVLIEPTSMVFRKQRLTPAPDVRVLDEYGNAVTAATPNITAALVAGPAALTGTTTVSAVSGRAIFANLVISDTGSYRIRFTSAGLAEALSGVINVVGEVNGSCATAGAGAFTLNLALGQTVRRSAAAPDAPTCLEFDSARAAGHQYLVLFENMPMSGPAYDGALFPGFSSGSEFQFAVRELPAYFQPSTVLARRAYANAVTAATEPYEWDFGDGVLREGRVDSPPGGVPAPKLLRGAAAVDLYAASSQPALGDTVVVYLQGIPRLGIPNGDQRAVVRHVSDHLIIAEDLRLGSLQREGGAPNTPLSADTMKAIADEYARFANVQGDRFFEARHNASVEGWGTPSRVLAVHTLMYSNNIWGYTYPSGRFFAFDYWAGTNGSVGGLPQRAQRVADNLFMHEIAHLRHHGLLERAGRAGSRGNLWLVEGFARFSERLPIANRLLGDVAPSRTGNVVLPRNTAFGNSYYYDDVPTYLSAGLSMLAGYGASAYVFDYFADQVARAGGDPVIALRDFLVNGGAEATLDEAVSRWLPGLTFAELFTRARIALYTDDYGPGLPEWTQYLQFQLRASRPAGSNAALDPRTAWLQLTPGRYELVDPVALAPGTARGVMIDGAAAELGSAQYLLDATRTANGVISITRIR